MVSRSPTPNTNPIAPMQIYNSTFMSEVSPLLSNLKGGIIEDVGWAQTVIITLLF